MPVIPALSLTITPYTALYTSVVPDAAINVGTSTLQGRVAVVLDFNAGDGLYSADLEIAFSWPLSAGTELYTWQPTLIEQPENTYNRPTDWIDCGGTGFIQGIVVEANTANLTKVFQLQDSDTLGFHALNEVGAGVAFNKQSVKAFSCTPFLAHSVRVVTTDGVPWQVWKTQLAFSPFPESTMNWQTELTAANGVGWQHLRQLNVEYLATSPVTLTFAVDSGNGSIAPASITIPASATQTKLILPVTANKWKLISLKAASMTSFNLFVEGMEMNARSWGSPDAYRVEHPFGGASKMEAVV